MQIINIGISIKSSYGKNCDHLKNCNYKYIALFLYVFKFILNCQAIISHVNRQSTNKVWNNHKIVYLVGSELKKKIKDYI